MKRNNYSPIEGLLKQKNARIEALEKQLAATQAQLQAAQKTIESQKSEIKRIKSQVIQPQQVTVDSIKIQKPTGFGKPLNIKETKSVDLSELPKDIRQRIHAARIYIPQFIERLREYTNLSETQLWQLENKLRTLSQDSIDEILNLYEIASMYYGSGQNWIMTETQLKGVDLYDDIMAYED